MRPGFASRRCGGRVFILFGDCVAAVLSSRLIMSAVSSRAIRCEDQLLEKLAQLEKQIASVFGDSGSANASSDTTLTNVVDGSDVGKFFQHADMSALLASVRQLVEHKVCWFSTKL